MPEQPLDWVFTIARNPCVSQYRARFVRRGTVSLDDADDTILAQEDSPEELAPALLSALTQLPERQRRALLLKEICGLSYEEIAAELEVSHRAVASLVFRARRALVASMRDEGRLENVRGASWAGGLLASLRALLEGQTASTVAATLAIAVATAALVTPPPRPTSPGARSVEMSDRAGGQSSRATATWLRAWSSASDQEQVRRTPPARSTRRR